MKKIDVTCEKRAAADQSSQAENPFLIDTRKHHCPGKERNNVVKNLCPINAVSGNPEKYPGSRVCQRPMMIVGYKFVVEYCWEVKST
ncbi:MAG: hypothetical protein ACUVRS_11005 [Armatimonadota bacterium]